MTSIQQTQEEQAFADPWLVAVWPGMGQVAVSAGYYLMAKLEMYLLAELPQHDFFDIDHIDVKKGLVKKGRVPCSRLFVHKDPARQRDIIVLIGEAQPVSGKYAFCRRLVDVARELGVQRVFTFAAMATQMHPAEDARVLAATTDQEGLNELHRLEVDPLEDGQIGGLNGILLAAAAEQGLQGTCLLGEMPHIFAHLPFPKASLAVLKVFTMIADIDLDTRELADQARQMEERLGELLDELKRIARSSDRLESEPPVVDEQPENREFFPEELDAEAENNTRELIERLFLKARQDRSHAYELKHELDRLGLYREYEDRFLDLFKRLE